MKKSIPITDNHFQRENKMATKLEKLTKDLSDLENKGVALNDELLQHSEKNQEIKTRLGAAVLDGKDTGPIENELTKHNSRFQALIEADKMNRQRLADMAKAIESEQRAQAIKRIDELSRSSESKFDGIVKAYYQMLVTSRELMEESNEADSLSSKTGVTIPSTVIRSRWGHLMYREAIRWFGSLDSGFLDTLQRNGAADWSKYVI